MNIAIIDDLAADRNVLTSHLQTYFTDYPDLPLSLYPFESGEEFLQSFRHNYFDFIFIDYFMGGMSGLEAAKEIRKSDQTAILVFTTISSDYAVDCYKVRASGYLLKPVTYCDLSEILSLTDLKKIRDREYILIENGTKESRVLLKDIIYCDISGHYTQIHTVSSNILRVRMAFSEIIRILSPYPQFLLCYRGCLVNMNQIIRMDELTFLLKNGEQLPFQKKERTKFLNIYSDFLFEKVRNSKA